MSIVAVAAVATVGVGVYAASQAGKGGRKYKAYGPWLAMKDDVMQGIRKGIEEGGYTWSEETGEKLQRQAMLNIASSYQGAERRAIESMTPYGAIGASGRIAQNINISRATEESRTTRGLDIARETQKLSSLQSLLQMGSGMSDPNLPGASGQMSVGPNKGTMVARSVEQGLAGYMYQREAGKERDFWQNFLSNKQSTSSSPSFQNTGIGGYQFALQGG